MNDLSARLSASIVTLITQFKSRPDGSYAGLSLPKTTMTSAVGRLENKGLVESSKMMLEILHPDERKTLVQLMEKIAGDIHQKS